MGKEKIKKITNFEEDCMWMSYRYCIGRSSISSLSHAHDIATNLFYRLSNDRKEFTAFDIAREIDTILRIKFNFHIEYPNLNKNFYPLEKLIEFIKRNDIRNLNEFNKYKYIKYSYATDKFSVIYDDSYVDAYHSSPIGEEQKEMYKIRKHYSPSDITDLLPWQELAACLDVHNLKVIEAEYKDEEKEFIGKYICFKTYELNYGTKIYKDMNGNDYEANDLDNIFFEEVWKPIEYYVDNGEEYRYIINDLVKSVRDITEKEINTFEKYEQTRN